MIKAKKLHAISIQLKSGVDAILVKDGEEWNTLQKFKCISPSGLEGNTVIATKDREKNAFIALMGDVFQIDGIENDEQWIALMASPEISAQIKATK